MIAEKISTEDIRRIGSYGELKVTLPDYGSCMSAKSLVTYTKNMYPREDNLTYKCVVDRDTNTITITTVDK